MNHAVKLWLSVMLCGLAFMLPAHAAPLSMDAALVPLETAVFAPEGTPYPRFMVDAAWPKMPPDLILGQIPGLAVDKNDVIWAIHRPQSLTANDVGLIQDPPIADVCCRPAPTIVRFAQDGRYLGGWGGPDTGPVIDGINQWPNNVHGIFVDSDNTVWFGGNGDDDHVVLNFTADGKFIRAIGRRGKTGGNEDRQTLGNPADAYYRNGRVLIADGYVNKRIIRFTTQDGKFDGYWGAYAEPPSGPSREGKFNQALASSDKDGGANPKSESFGDIVHCVVGTEDGYVYVCDRRNNRAQLFKDDGQGRLSFVRDIVIAPESGGTRTVSDVAFSPDGRYVYIAEMMNSRIWILDRKTHEPIATIGRIGRQPGQFTWLHSIDVDSDGNIYTTEVGTGRRIQKLVLMGIR